MRRGHSQDSFATSVECFEWESIFVMSYENVVEFEYDNNGNVYSVNIAIEEQGFYTDMPVSVWNFIKNQFCIDENSSSSLIYAAIEEYDRSNVVWSSAKHEIAKAAIEERGRHVW